VGSSNLTAGGMGFNYEGGLACTFERAREPQLADDVERYVKARVEDGAICKRLTPALLRRLSSDGWLADEERDRRHRDEDRVRAATRSAAGGAEPLFAASAVAKRGRLLPRAAGAPRGRVPRQTRAQAATIPDAWSKRLSASDAQHPPSGNPTGVVRLTPPPGRSDHASYFRDAFFARERWRGARDGNGNRLQLATIVVDAEIDGRPLGRHALTVDYGRHRDERGRATTILHWRGLLHTVQAADLTGRWLLIERGAGIYRLVVGRARPV
jgi:hypothetical protein